MENEANLNEINGRLRTIYDPYLQFLRKEFSAEMEGISFPLCMKVTNSYFDGKKKILFVGKEVGERYGTISQLETDASQLMDVYPQSGLCASKQGPFWDFIRQLNSRINGSNCNGFMWTTFSKFTYLNTTPPPEIQNRNEKGFELLREEIEILKPDMVYFLTGFSYDEQMRRVFHGIDYQKIQNNVMYSVSHNNLLPKTSFVLLHPKAMEERGIMNDVLDKLYVESPLLQV